MYLYDAIIVGGSLGGVLSAYSLAKEDFKVLLIEETDWIGGQLTSQGVPSDEHPYIEKTGATKSYREFRNYIRNYYKSLPNIKDEVKEIENLNPGSGWVSRITHEPIVSLNYLNKLLKPFVSKGNLRILLNSVVLESENTSEEVLNVLVKTDDEKEIYTAKYFIDATDNGDLLPLTNTKYTLGADSREDYNEPSAPLVRDNNDLQPITWVVAIEYHENKHFKMDKPAMYDLYKEVTLDVGVPLLSWFNVDLNLNKKREFSLFPIPNKTWDEVTPMFSYRQIVNSELYKDEVVPVSLINWPQNDYFLGNIIENDDVEYHRYAAKQLSLSLIYWLKTEAERHDGKGYGYPEIKLSPKTLGTKDGLAKSPYVRESRRIKSLFTVKEQDISKELSSTPPSFFDTVGVGHYHIDLHMTTKSKTYMFKETWPFQIPLGSLIPIEKKNLIAGCKNIGTTHLTNGCYRTHPVEWNIGESAGLLVAYCLKNKVTPHELYESKNEIKRFQKYLETNGIQLSWPKDVFEDDKNE